MRNLETYLSEISPNAFFSRAKNEAIEEWGEDIPMTLLFAKFGRSIANEFSKMSSKDRLSIFSIIEIGMTDGDEALKTLLATGLLEGLYGQISKDHDLTVAVINHLGGASKDYLVKWMSWEG
jgi:hypothetical protein